jgi:hypothetical protein
MFPFTNIEYLKQGNPRQQKVYDTLVKYGIMDKLSVYTPILVGTFPLDIDTHKSDIDIICECKDPGQFKANLTAFFGQAEGFTVREKILHQKETVIARFIVDGFPVEIFGQDLPTEKQLAFLHMIKEYQILKKFDDEFKEKIIELKEQGVPTEEAFARLLELEGDPYLAILDYQV